MCSIEKLDDFKTKIIEKVKNNNEYKDYIKQDINPKIYLIDDDFIKKMRDDVPVENIIKSYYQIHALGITIKYKEYESGTFTSTLNGNFILKERDILIFKYPESNENQILSTLTHELMHSLFQGIDNTNDEGNGYNEACTDFLAQKFYGKDYFTYYSKLTNRKGYLEYYDKFFNSNEEAKNEILKMYFS